MRPPGNGHDTTTPPQASRHDATTGLHLQFATTGGLSLRIARASRGPLSPPPRQGTPDASWSRMTSWGGRSTPRKPGRPRTPRSSPTQAPPRATRPTGGRRRRHRALPGRVHRPRRSGVVRAPTHGYGASSGELADRATAVPHHLAHPGLVDRRRAPRQPRRHRNSAGTGPRRSERRSAHRRPHCGARTVTSPRPWRAGPRGCSLTTAPCLSGSPTAASTALDAVGLLAHRHHPTGPCLRRGRRDHRNRCRPAPRHRQVPHPLLVTARQGRRERAATSKPGELPAGA